MLEPYYNIHPGEMIKDEIDYRHLTQRELAQATGIPYSQLNETLNGKRQLTTEMALLIGAVLGVDAEPLLMMQTKYNMLQAKRNPPFIERLSSLIQLPAVNRAAAVL